MKLFLLCLIFAAVAARPADEDIDQFDDEFGIKIAGDDLKQQEEEALKEAEEEIDEDNEKFKNGESSYDEKLYPFSDLDEDEFEKEKEGAIMPPEERSASMKRPNGIIMPPAELQRKTPEEEAYLNEIYSRTVAPASYDANALGLVTNARNQMSCGSCAAFAATGMHETCMVKAGAPKTSMDLSEQYLVDCGYNGNSMNACNGAYPNAYQNWFANNGGEAPHEGDQPYLSDSPLKSCPNKPKWSSGAKVTQAISDYSCNEEKMKQLVVEHGAVSIALNANTFGNYKSGVFTGCSADQTAINHAVLVVGYGTENGMKYWLVKNSWGESWGEQGFIKIERGVNRCGMEGICVVTKCVGTGNTAPAPPPPPPPPPVPVNLQCDVSNLFGAGLTGNYNLRCGDGTNEYNSEVKCTDSVCTPRMPGPSNACMYICGRQSY